MGNEKRDVKKLIHKIKASRLDKDIFYIVSYKQGYYHDKQPNYEWCFTNDLSLAKHYKTLYNGFKRAMYTVKHYPLISVLEVQKISDTKDGYSISEYKVIKTYDKKTVKQIHDDERTKKMSKKYKVDTTPLKVKVLKTSADDDFWS